MNYPEHKKLELFNEEQMNALNEFCEYMDNHVNMEFTDDSKKRFPKSEDVLYDFLKIDKSKLEEERRAMLANYT